MPKAAEGRCKAPSAPSLDNHNLTERDAMIIRQVRNDLRIDLTKSPPKRRARGKPKPSAWTLLRKQHLLVYPECRACGTTTRVVVHHLRYRGKRGESEQPGDLVTLCAYHHDQLHAQHGRTPAVEKSLEYIRLIQSIQGMP